VPTRFKTDRNWKRFRKAIDSKNFSQALDKHVRRALARTGKLAEATIRKTIQTGMKPPNAPLTEEIKKSEKPLVGIHGQLFQGITSVLVGTRSVFVGVLRTDKNYNIGLTVHEGKAIRVTERMRTMFWYLWMVSEGRMGPDRLTGRAAELWQQKPGGWYPLRDETKFIIIPARPFIKAAFDDEGLASRVKANWQKAVDDAILENA
jgi:hypothetical protein